MKKFARTISGVAPLAVMTEPWECPGRCLYCPTYAGSPQSYTPESPAVIRAIKCDYDARRQVEMRLGIFTGMGHPTDKVELIIMGGTFLAQPVDYQYRFIKGCYDGLNGVVAADLEEAKRINETAANRCTGLCIETRPDWCGEAEIERMLEFGTTRVEIGVQTLSDNIYRLVNRGHLVEDVIKANRLLRDHGFKVYYHWMPGLPGATPELDLALSQQLFEDENHRPDGLKLYPTMVVEGTELEKWWLEGKYHPYPKNEMLALTTRIKSIVPEYVRISRVLRDIPSKFIVAGLKDSLRDVAREKMKQDGLECHCIRCREYGHRAKAGREIGEPHLARLDYTAVGGREVFLSFEDDRKTLFGLLRLRVPSRVPPLLAGLSDDKIALVRELHVFGPQVPLSQQRDDAAQHKGLGRTLLQKAEDIALNEFHADCMAILSGVGAREYYRADLGYALAGDYMVKKLGC